MGVVRGSDKGGQLCPLQGRCTGKPWTGGGGTQGTSRLAEAQPMT